MNFDNTLLILVAALLAALLYGPVYHIFRALKIVDTPDWRKYNYKAVPLGGGFLMVLVLLMSVVVSLVLYQKGVDNELLILLLGGLALFIMGIIDDLYVMRASIKLIIQIIVGALTLLGSDILLNNFHGLFGVYDIGQMGAWILTLVYLVVFMNMFNLIDGIDGLASGVALTALIFVLSAFEMTYDVSLSVFICHLIGVLIVLYVRNHMPKKMYLGDSGSVTLGYLVGVLVLHNLAISEITFPVINYIQYGPVYAMVLFWYPLMDLGRVFVLRLWRRESPFMPDRRHFHHRLVDRGYAHLTVSLIVIWLTLCLELFSFFLSKFLSVNVLFFVMFGLTAMIAYLVFLKPTSETDAPD